MFTIQPGQTYRSTSNSHHPAEGPTRIRVKGVIPYGAAQMGRGTAQVVTITSTGREVRHRSIKLDRLHQTATTRDGEPRRTGYVLEQQ